MLVLRGISYPPSWGFEGTDLATLAHLECPTVCHGHPWREEDFCVIPTVCHGHPVQILLLTSSLKQAWTRPFVKVFCGERGIRTPETLLEFTRFPGVPLQPLEHLSFALATSNLATLSGTIHLTTRKGTKNI